MQDNHRRVRVLQPFRELRPTTNPYIVMLHEALAATPGVDPQFFSFRRAIFGRYDVVHVHWPETIFASGRSPVRRLARLSLAHLFLLRLKVMRIPVVRTVHNLDRPDGLSRRELAYLRGLDSVTRVQIHLNPHTLTQRPTDICAVVIPHGHYREWFAGYTRADPVQGRVSTVGLIRPYKNVDGLVRVFHSFPDDVNATLHVVGMAEDDRLRDAIVAEAGDDPRITFDFSYVNDDSFVTAVTSSQLVALPYRHMHNSGVVLTALSLDRPVLVPDNEVTRAVAEEVGRGWVFTFDGALTVDVLRAALDSAATADPTPPDLSARDWSRAGAAHRDAYLTALGAPMQHRSGERAVEHN